MKAYGWLFNLLTVFVLGLTTLFCLWSGLTFANPQFILNPLKPQSDALPAILPTSAPYVSPVPYPTLPPVWTATRAATASPAVTATASASAAVTAMPAATVTSAATNTDTPFPSPVGPTTTQVPTDLPSRTPTLKPPRSTATSDFYPGGETATPPAVTDTPVSYP